MAEKQSGFVAKTKANFARAQQRHPALAHVVAMVKHYGQVHGNVLAGAVTYFGFLSFFPILALAFSVIGYVSIAYPDARDSLVTAIEQVFPGIVTLDGSGNTIAITQIENAKAAAGLIGFVGVLYSGLSWLSGLRDALTASFDLPESRRRNFVVGKGIDVCVLAVLGAVLIVTVGVAGVAKGLADQILKVIGLDGTAIGPVLVWVVGSLLGLAASTLLFYVMYRLLGQPDLPSRPLWQGALLGAVGFEALKLLVVNVLGGVGGSAFAPLAIAVTLVIWINYFSRLVFYGASWAMTSRLSVSTLEGRAKAISEEEGESLRAAARAADRRGLAARRRAEPEGGFDLGSAILGGVAGALAALLFWRGD